MPNAPACIAPGSQTLNFVQLQLRGRALAEPHGGDAQRPMPDQRTDIDGNPASLYGIQVAGKIPPPQLTPGISASGPHQERISSK